jgi:hypothetical protein
MEDKLVYATKEPQIEELISDFRNCSPWSDGNWNRISDNESIRFTRWPDQYPDGKKHDTQNKLAFPFDGASDTRLPTADAIINENVAVCCAAFWRAMIRPKAGMTEGASYAVKLADYFLNTVLYHELVREVELSEQYRQTLGWVALHPTWKVDITMRRICVRVQDIVAAAQQGGDPNSEIALLAQSIQDPLQDEDSAALLEEGFDAYAKQQLSEVLEDDVKIPTIKKTTLLKAVRELREDGETYLPIPSVTRNQPQIIALKPWDEIFLPNSTTDIQLAARVYRRVWMNEVELRSMILTRGWNEEWVEQALRHKGQFTTWTTDPSSATAPPQYMTDAMASSGTPMAVSPVRNNSNLVEVIYAVSRQLDDDNVPGIYMTVMHASVTTGQGGKPLYGEHTLLETTRGEVPYVTGQRENWSRNVTMSRGVPQVAATWQRELKVQRDALVDHTSIGVTPPVLVPKGAQQTRMKFGPAVQNEVTAGREPKFMEVPGHNAPLAVELAQLVERDVDNYFGRMSEDVPPQRVQAKQAMLVQPFLLMWSKAIQQMLDLAQIYMDDAEFAMVTGAPQGWLEAHRNKLGMLAVQLEFDVRELDQQYVMQQLDTINKTVLPGDVAGVIDRAKVTAFQLRAINPALARELVADQQAASQQIFRDVQRDIAMMFLGNEAEYVESDPTAQTKLQFASQILQSNPNYQAAMQNGGRFAQLMKKWIMNLQFSITEEQNKKIGAIGVKPEGTMKPGELPSGMGGMGPGRMGSMGSNGNGGPPGGMQGQLS